MLQGPRVRLRAVERTDLAPFQAWVNDPVVTKHLLVHMPFSSDDETDWYERMRKNPHAFTWTIEDCRAETPRPMGSCGAHALDRKNGVADIGLLIGDPALWGLGLGTEACFLLVRFLHHEQRMHRVELEVFARHQRAIRSYQKLGFVDEGVRRARVFRDGRHLDTRIMSCLPGELVQPYDDKSV